MFSFADSLVGFDLSATIAAESRTRSDSIRAALPPSKRTPAAAVPDTPVGRAYLQLSDLARFVASNYADATASVDYTNAAGIDYRAQSIEFLTRVFDRLACNYSFEEFAADPRGVTMRILNTLLFAWDSATDPISFDYSPFGRIPFPMQANGTGFAVPPAIGAYWLRVMHERASNLGLLVVDFDLSDFIGYGTTWNFSPARGFYFVEGMTASGWYEGGGKAPPHFWPKMFRDYWFKIEAERERYNDKAKFANTVQWIMSFLALSGFVVALQAVIANGVTLTSGLRLAVATDRLPGVELGDASQVLSALSKLTSIQGFASNLLDSGSSLTDAAQAGTSGADISGEPMDFGLTDISIPNPDDFGAGFGDFGFTWGDIDFGAGFGGLDFTDSVTSGAGDFIPFDSALDSLTQSSGSWFDSIDLTKLITGLAQTYVQYRIADQRQGPRPGSAPTPGQTRVLQDGTTVRTNPDGSSTVTGRDGSVTRITPTGQIIPQSPATPSGFPAGGAIIPGVSNQTLLIGAAVGLGALLLLRKG